MRGEKEVVSKEILIQGLHPCAPRKFLMQADYSMISLTENLTIRNAINKRKSKMQYLGSHLDKNFHEHWAHSSEKQLLKTLDKVSM